MMARPEPVVIRAPALARAYSLVFGVFWIGFLIYALKESSASDALIIILMIAVGGAFIFRSYSQKTVADESGLMVRNFFRTFRFRWDEVEDFRLGQGVAGIPFVKVILVLLRDGDAITLDVSAMYILSSTKVKMLQKLRPWLPNR